MKTEKQMVKDLYNNDVIKEWERLLRHPVEYEVTRAYLDRYIKPGDRVLDIGGGPGRYSLYLAKKGCNVTLFDLSDANIAFAKERASEQALSIETVCGDACIVDTLVSGCFDHVLLMGPLYHLPNEADRIKAVNAAMRLLKTGGVLYSAFISSYAAVWDYMAHVPSAILDVQEEKYFELMRNDKDFSGLSFTQTYFISPKNVRVFMSQFSLEQLHIIGCESILALRAQELMRESPAVFEKWIAFAKEICERDEFINMTHHLLHVGRKLE